MRLSTFALPVLVLPARLAAAEDTPPPPEPTGTDEVEVKDASTSEKAGEIMVITGTRTETPLSESVVATTVVTREQVEQSGASDASDVLEAIPGVQVQQTFRGDGITMHGLGSNYVLVLVNGQRMTGRRDGGVIDLSRIPAERIERIEVVKGAASALYGSDAVAGVINVILREPEEPFSTETSARAGSRGLVDADEVVGLKRGPWAAGASAGYYRTDRYDWNASDAQTDGDDVSQVSLSGDLSRRMGASLRLEGDAAWLLRDKRGVDAVDLVTYDRRNLTGEGHVRLGVVSLPDRASKVQARLLGSGLRDQYVADQRGSDDLDKYEDTQEKLGQFDVQYDRVAGRHVATLGIESMIETMASPRISEDGSRWRQAAYVQDDISLGVDDQVSVVPSGRVDVDQWFGTHATPRLALRYDPIEIVALRANLGTGFRAPSFREMYLYFENPSAGYRVSGNPDLEPETSIDLSAGAEVNPCDWLWLGTDAFYNRLSNMIGFALVDEGAGGVADYQYVNVAEARSAGGEFNGRVALPGLVSADLGYTYTWSEDIAAGTPLSNMPPHRGTLSVTARRAAWQDAALTVRGEIVGDTPFPGDANGDGEYETFWADPYANLSARAECRAGWKPLRVFAGVDNFANAGDDAYVHLDPRTFYGGLSLRHPAR